MIEKLKLALLYLTYGMIVCCVAIGGFLLRGDGMFYPIAAVVIVAAIVCYMFFTIKHCRLHAVDLSTRFTGNLYFSIIMLLMCIAAYSEDRQEDAWWPLVVMAAWCSTVDLVRCVLNVFSETASAKASAGKAAAPAADAKAPATDTKAEAAYGEATPKQGIKMRCATRFCLMMDLYGLLLWLGAMAILLSFEGFTEENIIDKVPFITALLVGCLFFHFDKCVTINGRSLKLVDIRYYRNVFHMTMSDIDYVVVKRTIYGRRMTFHHGNNQKARIYPADADKIIKRLKLYNVDVREAESK